MTDHQQWVAPTLNGLAELLESQDLWDAPSLCEGWQVRHVVAHVTMPARLTPEDFGREMAAAQGDFTVVSNSVAVRDASLPTAELLAQLRSPELHAWQPPGGGAAGALSHAVIHSLDVTLPSGLRTTAPAAAVTAVRELLVASNGQWFGVDPSCAEGATSDDERIVLLAGRRLPQV